MAPEMGFGNDLTHTHTYIYLLIALVIIDSNWLILCFHMYEIKYNTIYTRPSDLDAATHHKLEILAIKYGQEEKIRSDKAGRYH